VRDVQIIGAILSGQRVDVRWTVENAGTGPTIGLSWTDAVFLSGDRFFDPTFDLYLGATVHSGTLAPGQRYDSGGVFDVPLGVSGSFYVFVVVDRDASGFDGVVVGSPASTTGSFPIALPLPSDLEVIEVVPPASGGAGSLAHVTWRVANVGGAAVQGRWTDALFLSRDGVFDLDDVFLGGFPSEVARAHGRGHEPALLRRRRPAVGASG
jgi:hypothetical protein